MINLGLLRAEKVGLNTQDFAHRVQPPVLLHPLLVVGNEQPAIVDPTRINTGFLEIRHKINIYSWDILTTDLLKAGDDLPRVGEQLDLCVIRSKAPEETSSVPGCA